MHINSNPIYLAIADDHSLVRAGFISLLGAAGNFRFIVEADNGAELLEKIKTSAIQPDICILDINMPIMNGYETLIELRKRHPQIKTLTLTFEETSYTIIKMLQAGTNGYIFKSDPPIEFSLALNEIYSYGFYFSHGIRKKFPQAAENNSFAIKNLFKPLEEEFLKYCCSLFTYKEIGNRMNLSEKTIQHYAERISERLNIKNHRIALAMFAVHIGIGKFEDWYNLI